MVLMRRPSVQGRRAFAQAITAAGGLASDDEICVHIKSVRTALTRAAWPCGIDDEVRILSHCLMGLGDVTDPIRPLTTEPGQELLWSLLDAAIVGTGLHARYDLIVNDLAAWGRMVSLLVTNMAARPPPASAFGGGPVGAGWLRGCFYWRVPAQRSPLATTTAVVESSLV